MKRKRTAEIVSIGDELTLGQIADTNAAHMADALARRGIWVRRVQMVGDPRSDIIEALESACAGGGVVLVSGGLGPTEDDRTREALALVSGCPLEEHPDLVAAIEARFRQFGRPMRPVNRRQALLPRGATGLPNPNGTAPGIAMTIGQARVFVMPGVPFEMRAMLAEQVLPQIAGDAGGGAFLRRELHCFGLGESTVGERIERLLKLTGPVTVGTRVSAGVVTVRLTARAESEQAARALLDELETEARDGLGDAVFGADGQTLAGVVVESAAEKGVTLATAESCTGGMVASLLTDIPGCSKVLLEGAVCYSNQAKSARLGVAPDLIDAHGAVSPEVASAMAEGMRERSGADIAVGITGIAGPGGGTEEKPVGLVYVALAAKGEVTCQENRIPSSRQVVRLRAACRALDMMRQCIRNW